MRAQLLSTLLILIGGLQYAFAGTPYVNTNKYKDNVVTYHCEDDTFAIEDPETGAMEYRIVRSHSMLLNNTPVFCDEHACEPVGCIDQCDLSTFIRELWQEEIAQMKGRTEHFYTEVVIDRDGKLAYFNPSIKTKKRPYTPDAQVDDILCSMETKLEAVNFVPAWIEGQRVAYSVSVNLR